MKKAIGVVVLVSAVAGAASAGVPDSKALDQFDRTGETVSCIGMRSTDITPIDERTLLFRTGGDYYANTLKDKCSRINDNFTRIELNLFSNRLCSGEIVKVVHQSNGAFLSSCSLGDFEKLSKRPAAAAEQ